MGLTSMGFNVDKAHLAFVKSAYEAAEAYHESLFNFAKEVNGEADFRTLHHALVNAEVNLRKARAAFQRWNDVFYRRYPDAE